jgi:hypothetical protein
VKHDPSIVAWIQYRLSRGTLPRTTPLRVSAGPGDGGECLACGEPIPSHDTGHELEWRDAEKPQSASMHSQCYQIWEVLRIDAADPA